METPYPSEAEPHSLMRASMLTGRDGGDTDTCPKFFLPPEISAKRDGARARRPLVFSPPPTRSKNYALEADRRNDLSWQPRSRGGGLSDGDKLIVVMLSDLFKQLKLSNAVIDPDFALEAIVGGHIWGLQWRYPGIFRRHEDTRAVVVEIFNIVQMWSFLEFGYHTLSQKDKARVAARVAPAVKQVRFDGFDAKGENEHLGVARFLIDQIDRFPEFKGRDLDAHGPTLDTHRRMLAMFEPMRRNLMGRHLTADDIIKILHAGLHPSGRNENRPNIVE